MPIVFESQKYRYSTRGFINPEHTVTDRETGEMRLVSINQQRFTASARMALRRTPGLSVDQQRALYVLLYEGLCDWVFGHPDGKAALQAIIDGPDEPEPLTASLHPPPPPAQLARNVGSWTVDRLTMAILTFIVFTPAGTILMMISCRRYEATDVILGLFIPLFGLVKFATCS
jgi:hypothetical protein